MGIGLLISSFGAGMLATINPCGFAMLPAYISYFLNLDSSPSGEGNASVSVARRATAALVLRAIQVGASTTAGFTLLFVSVGTIITFGAVFVMSTIPWVGLVIGAALLFMGLWVITGHHISIPRLVAPKVEKKRSIGGFFLYGIAYGLASLACTLPIFLAIVGVVFVNGEILQGIGQFVAFSLGMGLIIIALTVSLAFFKGAMVKRLRHIIPYVERISAVLLIAAGSYLVYYWLVPGRLLQRIF